MRSTQRLSCCKFLIALLTSLTCAFAGGCSDWDKEDTAPRVTVLERPSWINWSEVEDNYFDKEFTRSQKGVIGWPPDRIRRLVDITIDVTGSVFNRGIQYQDKEISAAEHNVHLLTTKLRAKGELELKPGDEVTVRLLGGGPEFDVYTSMKVPSRQVAVDVQVLTRSKNRKIIKISEPEKGGSPVEGSVDAAVNEITGWGVAKVNWCLRRGMAGAGTPLLDHLKKVRDEKPEANRLVVVVTDGHFQHAKQRIGPKAPLDLKGLMTQIEKSGFRPQRSNNGNLKFAFIGLYRDGDYTFSSREEQLLRWFLNLPESNPPSFFWE